MGQTENRTEGHKQIDVSYSVPDARAHPHAHIQIGRPWCMPWCRLALAGVFGQQSELLPSDDTACEDDVGTSAQSGAPMITMPQTDPGAQMGQPDQPDQPCCHPKFCRNRIPANLEPDWPH